MDNYHQCALQIAAFAKEFFDDSSDEDDNSVLEKVDNYSEFTIPSMTDRQFQMHFRLKPEVFEDLYRKVNRIVHKNKDRKTSLEKELSITIWYLSNKECFRSMADRFGVSKSTCWEILYRTSKTLLKTNECYKIISWPSRERQQQIAARIAGCIDGSHIPITAPKENKNSFINSKGFHSLLLQGVCDDKLQFTDVYAREVGSIHDYTQYKRSSLYKAREENRIKFHDDSHLVGDLAYKLSFNLLVGFKNNGHLTQRQFNFNIKLNKVSKNRKCFCITQSRFRPLKLMETVCLHLTTLLIVTSCILHNVCLMNGDNGNYLELAEEDDVANLNEAHYDQINIEAVEKRNYIMNALPIIN